MNMQVAGSVVRQSSVCFVCAVFCCDSFIALCVWFVCILYIYRYIYIYVYAIYIYICIYIHTHTHTYTHTHTQSHKYMRRTYT
jgi:hypothetical protein